MPVGKGHYHWDGAAGTWFWVDPVNDLLYVGMIQLLSESRPAAAEDHADDDGAGAAPVAAAARLWEYPSMPAGRPVDVTIRDESIRLGQFLKLADLAESGSDAKELIVAGEVLVNGEPETRRGRQLRAGDVVELDGRTARVAARPGPAAVVGRSSRQPEEPYWIGTEMDCSLVHAVAAGGSRQTVSSLPGPAGPLLTASASSDPAGP